VEPLKQYEIDVFNVVLDQVVASIRSRFAPHKKLFEAFWLFDPKNFGEVKSTQWSSSSLAEIVKTILLFADEAITPEAVAAELKDFCSKWDSLKQCLKAYPPVAIGDDTDEDVELQNVSQSERSSRSVESTCARCGNCTECCYLVLRKFCLYAKAYPYLCLAYKLILTLSVTQVSCERSFSLLRYIKNRLRSTMGQEKLESFMILASENDVSIDLDSVIEAVAATSSVLRRLLIP
jgi:hypothetical protein